MFQEDYRGISYPNILVEIEKITKAYMTTQFEHDNFFTMNLENTMFYLMPLVDKFAISNLSMILLKVC